MKSILAPLLVFLSISLASMVAVSCGGTNCKDPKNATSAECTVINATVTCTGSAFQALVAEEGPALEQAITNAILADGTIDYSKVLPALEDAALKFGGCFLSEVFGKMQTKLAAVAGGGSGSGAHELVKATPKALADTFEKFRVTHYHGIKFATGGAQ